MEELKNQIRQITKENGNRLKKQIIEQVKKIKEHGKKFTVNEFRNELRKNREIAEALDNIQEQRPVQLPKKTPIPKPRKNIIKQKKSLIPRPIPKPRPRIRKNISTPQTQPTPQPQYYPPYPQPQYYPPYPQPQYYPPYPQPQYYPPYPQPQYYPPYPQPQYYPPYPQPQYYAPYPQPQYYPPYPQPQYYQPPHQQQPQKSTPIPTPRKNIPKQTQPKRNVKISEDVRDYEKEGARPKSKKSESVKKDKPTNQEQENDEDFTLMEQKRALKGYLKSYKIDGKKGYDPEKFMNKIKQKVIDRINQEKKPVKGKFILTCKLVKKSLQHKSN